jgi:hypothetical protein
MISTIAVGTDGSATASEAVRTAADLARRLDTKLVVLSAFKDSAVRRARIQSSCNGLVTMRHGFGRF